MKKLVALITCLALLAAPTAALAHGHSASHKAKVCSVRSCKSRTTHKHRGKTYRAHRANDGHRYHKNHH